MKSGLSFIFVLIVMITACQKPPVEPVEAESLQITFTTSLRDTIPANTFIHLGIKDVQGVRLLDLEGRDIRYFEYKIAPDVLLHALSTSPFSINAFSADTVCRRLDGGRLQESQFRRGEMRYASSFIHTDAAMEVYESIKPPLRHLVLINRVTNEVLHRISNF